MPEKIIYALPEEIGNTELFVGRKKEFDYYLGDWYYYLVNNMAQSQAIVARRKKGKTAFLQRLFNILWSCSESKVIPFYYAIQEEQITRASFAKEFFATFASHYLSFLTRNEEWVRTPFDYVEMKEYITQYPDLYKKSKSIDAYEKTGNWDLMWKVASRIPFDIAVSTGVKVVQIIDEFQNINAYILDERGNTIDTMSGAYLILAEKREAPLIISGSEVHGLLEIVRRLTARFKERTLGNLPEDEAKEAIRRYAKASRTKINEQAEEKIWNLTQGDPLYIRALMQSEHNDTKDYTNEDNIIATYTQEITQGEIYGTWTEYIAKIFVEVNKRNAKRILLYLFQAGEERTRAQIIKDLKLDITDSELETKLHKLIKADLISRGETYFDYKIGKDKTYELVFRHLFQKEIDYFVPDIKKELRQEMGRTSYEKGKFREYLVRERIKKPFNLKDLAENGIDLTIKPKTILERETVKVGLRDREIDLIVKGNVELWIDVKDTKGKYGKREAGRWIEIKQAIGEKSPKTLFATYSQNRYTAAAKELLVSNGVYVLKGEEG
ncbi:MAG TPA: ATP-binding protein [Thermotogota bacterium]|nr:ATP-binding protein [Thermotogota bacterium]